MTEIIRTPTKVAGGITPEEKVKLDAHAKMWIRRILRTEPADRNELTRAIKDLYRVSGLKEPRVVVVPSPLVAAVAGGFAAAIWYLRKNNRISDTDAATDSATDVATYAATDSATDSATRSATYAATYAATDSATDSDTDSDTDSATSSATYAATYAAIRSGTALPDGWAVDLATEIMPDHVKFLISCARNYRNMLQGGNMWGQYDCYLTAMRDILGLRLPQYEAYDAWERAAIHGGYRIMHDEFCIVSDFPEFIRIDDQNRAHCETGPSHRWRDGWEVYSWHGVQIPPDWINRKNDLDQKTALTWGNVEQRRAACEIIGWEKILSACNARVIDTDPNVQIGTLLEVDLPDAPGEKFLRYQCGTGRMFAHNVGPSCRTAREAQAWIWQDDDYNPAVRT